MCVTFKNTNVTFKCESAGLQGPYQHEVLLQCALDHGDSHTGCGGLSVL